ncbi:hypothetical protein ScPMuIL_010035 [Solemya velum]
MALYLITICWNLFSLAIILAYIYTTYGNKAPGIAAVKNLFYYGKVRGHGNHKLMGSFAQVPKRWFAHFYIVCVVCTAVVTVTTIHVTMTSSTWPHFMGLVLDHLRYPQTEGDITDVMPVILVLLLELVQGCRRTYECLYISSYSKSTISIPVYLTGILFYASIGLSLVVPLQGGDFVIGQIHWNQFLGTLLFGWASFKQHKIAKIFAKLRQNKTGTVMNHEHHVPHGDLFEYVSCPHYLLEILIYFSFFVICGINHPVCLSIFLFVLSNQTIAGYITHIWYQQKFPKYPRSKTAVFPFFL